MSNHGYAKDFYLLGSANILKKLDDLEKANDCLRIQISAREEVCEKYKKAIDEAIKYIEKFIPIDEDTILMRESQKNYLLDILKGVSK